MTNWLQTAVKACAVLILSLLGTRNAALAQDLSLPAAGTTAEAPIVAGGRHPGGEFVSHVAVGRAIRYPTDSNGAQLAMRPL